MKDSLCLKHCLIDNLEGFIRPEDVADVYTQCLSECLGYILSFQSFKMFNPFNANMIKEDNFMINDGKLSIYEQLFNIDNTDHIIRNVDQSMEGCPRCREVKGFKCCGNCSVTHDNKYDVLLACCYEEGCSNKRCKDCDGFQWRVESSTLEYK